MSMRAVIKGGALLVSIGLLAGCATFGGAPLTEPVATENGLVAGVPSERAEGVMAFRGLPFGAPPVGDLRWRPPAPVEDWEGVRSAAEFGPICNQPASLERTPNNRSVNWPGSPPVREDCLYLNVWTPAERSNANLPVMLWIFPGAYYEGAGSTPVYLGDNLAGEGVVVVTINYRLGPMGFLAHPELTAESEHGASGNYALMDSIAALEWVQANIAAFGGDPERVTIFGESAGSAIVTGLVGSPEASGLFTRAIAESATFMGLGLNAMVSREQAEAQTVEIAEGLGMDSLADLRAMPAEEVSEKLPRQGMIIDGWIVPEDLSITFADGRQNAVDMIVGSNRDEGSFFGAFGPPVTAESWRAGASQRWGEFAELGLAAYPAETDEEALAASTQAFNDNFAYMMRLIGERQVATGNTAYAYFFVHEPPYDEETGDRGVCHTCEIRYVFKNLDMPGIVPDVSSHEIAPTREVDQQVADIMSSYWTNFAADGDPNGEGLATWPAFMSVAEGPVLQIDVTPEAGNAPLTPEKIALYDAMFEKQVEDARGE